MRLNTRLLSRVEIPRNNVVAGYKNAYINDMVQKSKFKNKFLSIWDGVEIFSLLSHPKREEMTRLLGLHNSFNGETDLAKTGAGSGFKDFRLCWTITQSKITTELKDKVMENIHDVFDRYGYTFKYSTFKGITINDEELPEEIDDFYILVASNITRGAGIYTFTFNQVESQLKYDIFERVYYIGGEDKPTSLLQNNSIQSILNKTKTVTGIMHLATFGIIDIGSEVHPIFIIDEEGRQSIDSDKFKQMPPDYFHDFVSSFLNFNYVKKRKSFLQKLLTVVLVIISIVTIVWGGYAILAYAFTGSTTALMATAAVGLTTMSMGAVAGAVILAANIYGSVQELMSLQQKDEAKESVSTPAEIDKKMSMSEETYWDNHTADKPEAHIENVLNYGKM